MDSYISVLLDIQTNLQETSPFFLSAQMALMSTFFKCL